MIYAALPQTCVLHRSSRARRQAAVTPLTARAGLPPSPLPPSRRPDALRAE